MDDDQLIQETLEQLINCRKQPNEESLNTLPEPSKDQQQTKDQTRGPDASENSTAPDLTPQPRPVENEQPSVPPLAKPPEEEQIVIDEGKKVGNSIECDLNLAGKVKVDSFLDLEDFDMDEEIDPESVPELLLLPGEVEEEYHFSASGYIPCFDQYSQAESKTLPPTEHLVFGHFKEVPGDEVQPFSLDEDFDYDNVILTPKFSSAEMKTIEEMSSQTRLSPDTEAKESNN